MLLTTSTTPRFPYTTLFRSPLCGQLRLSDGRRIQKILAGIPEAEIRLSMDEEMYIRNLTEDEVGKLLEAMKDRMMMRDRKSTRLNSSHVAISYAVFCLKKKK